MNRNKRLSKLRKQLDKSFKQENVQYPEGLKKIKRSENRIIKSKKTVLKKNNNDNNNIMSILLIILFVLILIVLGFIAYNLFYPQTIFQPSQPTDNPTGVIIPEGAPISVEKGGDITENKFLTEFGGVTPTGSSINHVKNSIQQNDLQTGFYGSYAPYQSQSNYEGAGLKSDSFFRTEDGITKIYYENVSNSERQRLNDYIRKQNQYVGRINKRIKQINKKRMYGKNYLNDKKNLKEIREYERRLANKIQNEREYQPELCYSE